MTIYLEILLLMTLLGATGSFFLKKASDTCGLVEMLKCANLYIGAVLYFVSAGLNIIVLRHLDYSVVLPLTSITYVWTMILSYLFLKEHISDKKKIGVVFILVGAGLVSI